ncbi:MAG: hypothetical protein IKG42_02775 [Clostridia bacterium]|nr:hypothetical protein [Clostridia bacterium]
MNKKQKDRIINLILLCISFILIILYLILVLKISDKDNRNSKTEKQETNETVKTVESNTEDEEIVVDKDVESMNEKERMIYYINEFIDKIEEKNYENAYKLLYSEFKDNYFETEEKFKNYAETYFNTDTLVMNFQNIERLGNPVKGNIYVVWMKKGNLFDVKSEEEKEDTKFVILEKDYDDFELSFSVENR